MRLFNWKSEDSESDNNAFSWNARKRYICYRILTAKDQRSFALSDFVFPFNYPRSSFTNSFELLRVAKCLFNLTDIGITIKAIETSSDGILVVDNNGNTITDYSEKNKVKEASKSLFMLLLPEILAGITTLNSNGEGDFTPDLIRSSWLFRVSLEILTQARFVLEIKIKAVEKAVQTDLQSIVEGIHPAPACLLGHMVSSQIIDGFIHYLLYFGKNAAYELSINPQNDKDKLYKALKNEHEAFVSWEENKHEFDFLTHLLVAAYLGKIDNLEILPAQQIEQSTNSFEELLKHDLFDQVPLQTTINFTIKQPAITSEGDESGLSKQVITQVEMVEVADPFGADTTIAYLNGVYDPEEAIVWKKSPQNAQLLYDLCEAKDNLIDASGRDKTYSYINKNLEFVFFSKTNYDHSQILSKDKHGNIVPANGVSFGLISVSEEKAKIENFRKKNS